jgi:hypothetical protein
VVSPNYFAVLGSRAARGRVFSAADAAGEPIVVISDTLWRRAFNADPLLVGQAITLTGRGYTVLGTRRGRAPARVELRSRGVGHAALTCGARLA